MVLEISVLKARMRDYLRENNCDLFLDENDNIILKNCNTIVDIVENLMPEDIAREWYLKNRDYSYLFLDVNGEIMFVDNNDTWEDYRDIYYNHDIYVIKCPKCNKISFVNVTGSYECRNCGDHNGDHSFYCYAVDFFKEIFKVGTPKEKYDNYINSDAWQKTRQYALDKHGRKCTICGSTTNLEVHHLNYDNLGYEAMNDYADLCILCHNCHLKLHEFIKNNENMLINLKNNLKELKEKYKSNYLQEIEDIFYNHIKECFNNTNKKHALIIPYLKTIWGQKKLDTNFISYISAQKVYCRLKNEEKLK